MKYLWIGIFLPRSCNNQFFLIQIAEALKYVFMQVLQYCIGIAPFSANQVTEFFQVVLYGQQNVGLQAHFTGQGLRALINAYQCYSCSWVVIINVTCQFDVYSGEKNINGRWLVECTLNSFCICKSDNLWYQGIFKPVTRFVFLTTACCNDVICSLLVKG